MKTEITVFALTVTTFACVQGSEVKQPLTVQVPENWRVDYNGKNGIQFYRIKLTEGESMLLMFSRWPVEGGKEEIPHLLDTIAKGFIGKINGNKGMIETLDYRADSIEGEIYSGKFVAFPMRGGLLQTIFMIGNGDEIWSGQFTGSKERWNDSLNILKKIKKNS